MAGFIHIRAVLVNGEYQRPLRNEDAYGQRSEKIADP